MFRKLFVGAFLALALVGVSSQIEACEACARMLARHEGKLVKEIEWLPVEKAPRIDLDGLPQASVIFRWKLKTASKTYTLHLGSRTLTRLAQKLDGMDVIVTGPLNGETIDVRNFESKEKTLTGVLVVDRAGQHWLVDGEGRSRLVLENKTLSRRATELDGHRVQITGTFASNGIVVASIDAVK